ncbi:hypothetical protein BZL54_02310 [Burkholderia ubonensis subsp. mesacidophila]|uniref:Knr4/Smi1-like domain-containing protein n=1 Tax=Burkholderia ubonensis subsp. mesacidophila TaxID=265293 RepID=A0A2A4FKX1_9BURK|nr:hypothetical protein BZL54_02310 [Burkholderia ubonensis subsp. mesacidophila]
MSAPSSDEILRVEAALGVRLPQEYLSLLGRMNGAFIQGKIFDIPGGNNAGVSQFVPFDKVLYEKSLVEQTGPTQFVPIAHASGGNYVCMSMKGNEFGSIYFFDHEIPGENAFAKVALNISQFLDMLRPFSVDDVRLDPNDVGEVWIAPDFLKKIKGE